MANRRVKADASASDSTVRASISFPEDQYKELERIAAQQRVSLAWVVRDAIEEYLKTRWPLLVSSEARQVEE
jgi:metal-responsive CopG/Arc/MetJ family transcriptional regulator